MDKDGGVNSIESKVGRDGESRVSRVGRDGESGVSSIDSIVGKVE